MIWLGEKRGNLSDWTTQQWVRVTGHYLDLADHPWLDGPAGGTRRIGREFFENYAQKKNLEIAQTGVRGLISDFCCLEDGNPGLQSVALPVKNFYEQASEFDLDSWSEWSHLFKPFGKALSVLFSTRLQQLNVPLSPLDSSKGMTSEVIQLRDPQSGQAAQTAWVRELLATENVLYAGSYSVCRIPGHPSPCVKVVFPLPNGNGIVLMKPEAHADGSLSLKSIGNKFGDPGFYFVVHNRNGTIWARYVKSLKEEIHVYPSERGIVRADHTLRIWGTVFLRLHYKMSRRP